MKANLVHITPNCEALIGHCARVSSPNSEGKDYKPLLKYCIRNQHWSIFQMGNLCVEINTSRAIAQQMLRHRSFSFQEFSQRYSKVTKVEKYEARRQDEKNRQNSIDDMSDDVILWFYKAQEEVNDLAISNYEKALSFGIAKEQARFLLPLATETKLYMNGTIRDWIHYINLRTESGTQLEHQRIAKDIQKIFIKELPTIASVLEW